MNNTIVSSPNVNGNIGSCSTSVVDVIDSRKILTETHKEITTNSCTGEVQYFTHWEMTGTADVGILAIIIMLFAVIFGVVASSGY